MSSNITTITLYINNMTCVNCENTIERALSAIEGVESVKASYSAGTVIITYNQNKIKLEELEKVIKDHDYHVEREKAKQSENKAENSFNSTSILSVAIILFALYVILNRFGLLDFIYTFPIAKEGMGYGMLFVIGLLTSVHCVAMCGGICLSQCTQQAIETGKPQNKFSAIKPSLMYNIGRVISYTVIGGIVGALGSVVSFSGTMKGIVQILAGVFMVIMGLNMLNVFPWLRKFNPRMPKVFAKKIYAQKNSNSPLYIGLLNGLMPCGPLQAMQLYALSTGSPVQGALSMFLFSVGTVPLMFTLGALSSFLSKKFSSKMMTASAVLVMLLGVYMFSSGASLSGLSLPVLPSTTSQAESNNVAVINDGVQTITTSLSPGSYEPIVVQKGIPVKWTIQAEEGSLNGCNNSIVIPKYNIQMDLSEGDNIIEFTPTDSGTVPFSCWMGMIRSKITVVDDLGNADSNTINSEESNLDSEDNLVDYQIPTDELAIAEIADDGVQTVELTLDENGLTPAVAVVQSGLKTKWIINGKNVDSLSDNILIFPNYSAQLEILEGENPITFYPEADFDFFTSDTNLYGYVKVVDDIKNIDETAIKEEIAKYRPSDYYAGGGGLPSCH